MSEAGDAWRDAERQEYVRGERRGVELLFDDRVADGKLFCSCSGVEIEECSAPSVIGDTFAGFLGW